MTIQQRRKIVHHLSLHDTYFQRVIPNDDLHIGAQIRQDLKWKIAEITGPFTEWFKGVGGGPWDAEILTCLTEHTVFALGRLSIVQVCRFGESGEVLDERAQIGVVV